MRIQNIRRRTHAKTVAIDGKKRLWTVLWAFSLACALIVALFVSPAFAENKPTPKTDLLNTIEGDHALGNPEAKVTIIEYASLSCPHCASFHKETFPALKERYIDKGKVFFIFRHFPFNEPALRGAMLTECAGDKYFTFLKVLFNSQDKWAFSGDTIENLRTIANVGGIGAEKFDKCMADKKTEDRIVAGVSAASKELGVSSTPTIFINGEKIEAARDIDFLVPKIDALLSK